jgi:hypothetical protein
MNKEQFKGKPKDKKAKFRIKATRWFVIIIFLSFVIINYRSEPSEVYKLDSQNLIPDGSFENFNQQVGDCCTTKETAKNAIIFSSKSTDAFDDSFSLNLTASNHCACISKPITNFDNSQKYFMTFYYKGDNPKLCGWTGGDNKCIPYQIFPSTLRWTEYKFLLLPTTNSLSSAIYLYADSYGGQTVTNLYDDLQVHKLIKISNSGNFLSSEKYVIKTNPENIVHNGELLDDKGWYLVTGKPNITLKFPYSEIILMVLMMLVVIRLLLKKDEREVI